MKKNLSACALFLAVGAALFAQQSVPGSTQSASDIPAGQAAAVPGPDAATDGVTGPAATTQTTATATPQIITLQQAIDAAIAQGPDMKVVNATLDVARAQHALDETKGAFSLSATGGYSAIDGLGSAFTSPSFSSYKSSLASYLGTTSGDLAQSVTGGLALSGPTTKVGLALTQTIPPADASPNAAVTGAQLSLTQTVWDGYPGGQVKAALDKSLIVLQGRELSAQQGRSAAIAKVKQAYVTMLTDQRALGVKQQILKNQNSLLAQLQAIYNLKQASTIDLMTAQVNARGAELDVAQSDHDLRLARQRLANIIGLPPDSQFSVAETEDPALPAASLDEAIAIGLRTRQDIAQLDLSRRSSGIDLLLAKASAQPNVSLTGGFNYAVAVPSGASALDASSVSAGAKIALPVVDAGAAGDQAAAASRQIAVYDAQKAQLAAGIAADIRDGYENTLILKDRIDNARKNMEALDALFTIVKTQNQFGTATTQDVLTASVNAANAETAYQTARNAYLLAVLSLETSMGL